MTVWSYESLERLFAGNTDYVLYMSIADSEAVFFNARERDWFFSRAPSSGWEQSAPEIIEDWIGSLAEKEHGTEPVLMHRDELDTTAQNLIEAVEDGQHDHCLDELARYRNPPDYWGIEPSPGMEEHER